MLVAIFILLFIPGLLAKQLGLEKECEGVLFESKPHPFNEKLFIGCLRGETHILECPENETFDELSLSCVGFKGFKSLKKKKSSESSESCECDESSTTKLTKPPKSTTKVTKTSTPKPKKSTTKMVTKAPKPEKSTTVLTKTTRPKPRKSTKEMTTRAVKPGKSTTPLTKQTKPKPGKLTTSTEYEATTWPATIIVSTPVRPEMNLDPDDGINISFSCPDSGFGKIPHKTNCSKYYECVNGLQNLKYCENGQIFDVATRACGDPSNSFCSNHLQCSFSYSADSA